MSDFAEKIINPTFNFSVKVEIYHEHLSVSEDDTVPFNVQYVHFNRDLPVAIRKIGNRYHFHRIDK